MSYTHQVEDFKGYEVKIVSDDSPDNPRTEWDNLGTMICFHKRYQLGDTNHGFKSSDFASWTELYNKLSKDAVAILPVYMYDHSGITISTEPFSCSWDSGQIGVIFVSKEKVRKEFSVKRISSKLATKITEYLKGEVETYDTFLRGEVVGYEVEKDGEQIDSCYGYYSIADALSEGKGIVTHTVKRELTEHFNKVKAWVKNKVPFNFRTSFNY